MNKPERLSALEREDVDTVRFVQALVDAAPDLIAVALAAQKLRLLHRDVLGLPTISQDDLDAASEAWSKLRSVLAPLLESEGSE